MRKTRSTWASLLSIVLAMVVMAGLAITSFATADGRLPTEKELTDLLEGTENAIDGVDYDVDSNGIVEWDDLACLRGEQKDLMPNGDADIFSLLKEESKAHMQSAIVLGDSTKAASTNAVLEFKDAFDLTGYANLKFSIFWRSGELTVMFGESAEGVSVTPQKAGWSEVTAEIPEEYRDKITKISFSLTGGEEGAVAYIDNIRVGDADITADVVFNSVGGTAVETQKRRVGATYGELPVPAKTFYTFEGWYLDANYSEKVSADTVVAAEAEHTLYAKWSLVTGEDGTITVADKGSNTFGITMDGS